jgi:ubiquinone/menaquinone biosynthesis C-methylase UbiE
VDIAVFCLALMGTDYPSFLEEAHRVLKPQGLLWIAEVRLQRPLSRFLRQELHAPLV